MEKVKLSSLSESEIVITKGYSTTNTIEDILEDIEFYREKQVYTTTPYNASFNAESIIDDTIENEYQNMYEDWNERIRDDVTKEDIEEIQAIFDRILARSSAHNIVYIEDKLIEFDI